jgi:two-component system, OmpR family, response regulator CpxR
MVIPATLLGGGPLTMERLLIVDDDLELCDLVTEYLGSEGFAVDSSPGGPTIVEQILGGTYDLIILDVMIPGMNGFDILRRLRAHSHLPVLMLTARGDEIDRIIGLEIGADDYLPKPFNPRELVARIRAILRRYRGEESETTAKSGIKKLKIDDLELDHRARMVWRQGSPVELTSVEFNLLEIMMQHAGNVVTRDELAKSGLGRDLGIFDRSIDMHVSNLRKKLGPHPRGFERIKTIRGVGYILTITGQPEAGKEE